MINLWSALSRSNIANEDGRGKCYIHPLFFIGDNLKRNDYLRSRNFRISTGRIARPTTGKRAEQAGGIALAAGACKPQALLSLLEGMQGMRTDFPMPYERAKSEECYLLKKLHENGNLNSRKAKKTLSREAADGSHLQQLRARVYACNLPCVTGQRTDLLKTLQWGYTLSRTCEAFTQGGAGSFSREASKTSDGTAQGRKPMLAGRDAHQNPEGGEQDARNHLCALSGISYRNGTLKWLCAPAPTKCRHSDGAPPEKIRGCPSHRQRFDKQRGRKSNGIRLQCSPFEMACRHMGKTSLVRSLQFIGLCLSPIVPGGAYASA